MKAKTRSCQRLDGECDRLEARVRELEQALEKYGGHCAAAKSRIGVLEQERDTANETVDAHHATLLRVSKERDALQAQLAAVILDRDALSYELDSFKSENESFRAECVPLRNAVAQLQGHNKATRDALEQVLLWIYPWETGRRSEEFIEEAIIAFRLIGRKHPFENVEHIEKRLDAALTQEKP